MPARNEIGVRADTVVRPYVAFLLILSIGTFLRFHGLDRQSLWDDEMTTLKGVHSATLSEELHLHRVFEPHPPLFHMQLRLWEKAFGSSLGTLRANSALWGSLSLVLFYFLFSLYSSRAAALAGMAFLAISPLHLAYSQELRPYALGFCLALAGWLTLERILRRERAGLASVVLLALVWTLQLYTHYWESFVCLAAGIYGLTTVKTFEKRRTIVIAGAVAVGLFGFWVPVLRDQLNHVGPLSFWMPPASWLNLPKTLMAYSGLHFRLCSSSIQVPGPVLLLYGIGLIMLGGLIAGLLKGPLAARLWLAIGLLVPFAISYWFWGMYLWYRYPFFMLSPFVMLLIAGLWQVRASWLRGLILGALLASQAAGVWVYKTTWEKANPKAVVAYIHRRADSNTVVVRPYYFGPLYSFYDRGLTSAVDQHTFDSDEKRLSLKGHKVLLVAFDVPPENDPVTHAFLRQYEVVTSRQFPGFGRLGITVYDLQ